MKRGLAVCVEGCQQTVIPGDQLLDSFRCCGAVALSDSMKAGPLRGLEEEEVQGAEGLRG
eukprot:CAMPEP_0184288694 /NCGR_PEP_ID=MMETSP1049-20130417/1164_1 /TAXON_ID=77928 /ORGANISM="Proteomonas sulcata, Strain CCMP704" /LENGTH=59 /DNA_ID=CAMNT_0026595193 /DNA_START=512 /DNA_END=691 /DNA_ORIENTATION=-